MAKLIKIDLEEFKTYIESLPDDTDLLSGSNPFQNPIVRYLNKKAGMACFYIDGTGYYSQWYEFRGSKKLPEWVKTFLILTWKQRALSKENTLDVLEYTLKWLNTYEKYRLGLKPKKNQQWKDVYTEYKSKFHIPVDKKTL